MSVTVVAQRVNAATTPPGASPVPPGSLSLPVPIPNTPGDWLFAACAWRQYAPGAGVTVSVGDDAHNRWEPLGAPAGDSPAAGVTRVSLWYAPAARLAATRTGQTTVMCAPTGPVAALAMAVIDVAGLNPWDQVAFAPATGYALAATSLGLSSPAPPAQALAVTAAATDLSTASVTFAGTGWTALTGTSCVNGTDHTGDLELAAQWQLVTGAESVTWSSTLALDLAAVIGAIIVNPAGPTAPNPNWPAVITEAAPGAGALTPPSEMAWQSLSHRDLGVRNLTQGQPYLLGAPQAAQGGLTLDNPDLAVTPPGDGPWAGTDSGTPVRVRAIIPASATPHYVAFSGNIQQAPTSFDAQLRGQAAATVTDAYAYATGALPPVLQAELLSEPSLYALWPLNDPAGATAASNVAPGNSKPLTLVESKYGLGTGPAAVAFGANSGALKGDSGAGMFSQTGVDGSGLGHGWSLGCADSGYPPITGGVTVEVWSQFTATTPSHGDPITLMTSAQIVLEAKVVTGGNLQVNGYQNASVSSTVTVSTLNFLTAPLWHLAVAFTRTTYAIYVNGALAASGTWAHTLPPAFTQCWVNGNWGTYVPAFGQTYNGYSSYAAIFGEALPAARVASHYQAGATAFAGDYAHYRVERILGYAGLTGRRVIVPEAPGMPGAFTVPASTPPQDVTPMASMATLGGTTPSLYTPGTPGFAPASGTQASQALADTAASTVPAVLAMARTGDLFCYPRGYAAGQATAWTLGDLTGIPVWGDATYPYDPSLVRNDIQLTQPDTGTTTVASIGEAPSQGQYGDQSYSVSAYLEDDATSGYTSAPAMTDLADWIASVRYSPRLRAQFTVKASHAAPGNQAAAWEFVMGACAGDIVTITAQPATTGGAAISVTGRIMQTTWTCIVDGGEPEGSLTCVLDSAPELATLTCDDPVLGVLGGQNVLGW